MVDRKPVNDLAKHIVLVGAGGIHHQVRVLEPAPQPLELPLEDPVRPRRRSTPPKRFEVNIESDEHIGSETFPEIFDLAVFLPADISVVAEVTKPVGERRLAGRTGTYHYDLARIRLV